MYRSLAVISLMLSLLTAAPCLAADAPPQSQAAEPSSAAPQPAEPPSATPQAPAPPSAEPQRTEPRPPEPTNPNPSAGQNSTYRESLSHRGQIGLGVRIGSGYRVIFPRNEENCGEKDDDGSSKSVCRGLYPMWLELSPSFGLTPGLELLVDVRLFLEAPSFTDSTGLFIAPGLKFYTDAEDMLKFFLTAQLMFELQDQAPSSDLAKFDFGLRSAFGMQIDLLRYVGLYAQAGLVFGFTRWLSFLVDFGGGLQFRY